jgi:hypothetical protein
MLTAAQLKNRREDLLEEMRGIRRMKRGQLSEQMLSRTAADGSRQQRGPYYTLQAWKDGKNHSQRVPQQQLPAVREAVEGYQKLKRLAEEFAEVTETLTELSGPLLPEKKTPRGGAGGKVRRNRSVSSDRRAAAKGRGKGRSAVD